MRAVRPRRPRQYPQYADRDLLHPRRFTSLTALGHVAPHVGEATARALLRYGWQAGCGLYACFGGAEPFAAATDSPAEPLGGLVDRAIANGDEHAIKFTEACLARHALAPSPAYPAAVVHALAVIGAH